MSSDRRLWQPKLFVPAVALLFLVYGLEIFLSARLESQTFDEPAHLYAGCSYWLRSDFGINPEHPPLVKLVASLPLLVDKPAYPEPTNYFFRADSAIGARGCWVPPAPQCCLTTPGPLSVSLPSCWRRCWLLPGERCSVTWRHYLR